MRRTRDQVCMEIALVVAMRGTCSRLQVGAVIARDGRVLSTGYNGAPAGMPHCDHTCVCGTAIPELDVGHFTNCPAHPENSCNDVVHAEVNAIAFAARHGVAIEGADLFTSASPCDRCAAVIINSGLARVRYLKEFSRTEGLELLRNAGLDISMLV